MEMYKKINVVLCLLTQHTVCSLWINKQFLTFNYYYLRSTFRNAIATLRLEMVIPLKNMGKVN